jgi:hypothetical protein
MTRDLPAEVIHVPIPTLASIRRTLRKEAEKAKCPNIAEHTPDPHGYVAWHDWAEEMGRTHRQIRCPGCGLLAIWVPKKGVSPQAAAGTLRKLRRRFGAMEPH